MDLSLQEALINAYRTELKKRYQHESNVQRFPLLVRFSKEKRESIELLSQFFLEYLYPPFSQRIQRDMALNALVGILKSPSKLWPLSVMSLGSLIGRFAWDLGAAFKAGFRSIEVYLKSLDLEKLMIQEAQKLSMDSTSVAKNESASMKKIMAHLNPKKVLRFQKDIFAFFAVLANHTLLIKVIETMRISQGLMEKHPLIYSEQEKAGLGYGLKMLENGYQIFCELAKEEVELILGGIRLIEEDWYAKCLQTE